MADLQTIELINGEIVALGAQKGRLPLGNADRPDRADLMLLRGRIQIVCRALDAICREYEIEDADFRDWAADLNFERVAERAEERRREKCGPRYVMDEDYCR